MARYRFWEDAINVVRGLMMGAADIVPGVSGGTVALVLGIYERLVTAISHFDMTLLAHVRGRRWQAALEHMDVRFLAALGCGILLGVGLLAHFMSWLLSQYPEPTWSLFFGLILASSLLVARMVQPWSWSTALIGVGGVVFAYWLVGLLPATPPEGHWYLFLCGAVGSCAMILPGISGAFIVLIMGKYLYITSAIDEFVHGRITLEVLSALVVFAGGWAVGILSFSKGLRWLLNRYEPPTLALLGGFMLGSLRKIWPFKRQLTEDDFSRPLAELGLNEEKLERFTVNVWPDQYDAHFWFCVALAVAGFVLVLVIDRLVHGHEHVPPLEAAERQRRSDP